MSAIAAILLGAAAMTVHAGDAERARYHWIVNCQGCHQADASGSPGGAPNMAGAVSRFLSVDGGREYLGKVPGVAFAPLTDADLAELLNWSLRAFDPKHLPADFTPYDAEEIGRLRAAPLISEAAARRRELAARFPVQ